jgi:hypothetical protein
LVEIEQTTVTAGEEMTGGLAKRKEDWEEAGGEAQEEGHMGMHDRRRLGSDTLSMIRRRWA